MTELEFEKACRGPLKPVPDEIGPGYWGVRELNVGGTAWRVISVAAPEGRQFAGTHGCGTTALPADWSPEKPALTQRGGGPAVQFGYDGPFDLLRTSWRNPAGSKEGELDGWRGVRTAPLMARPPVAGDAKARAGFKLELDALPDVGNLDVAIFYLAGRFHNPGDQAVPVELTSSLPDACFPEGAAARTFTAAPKTATPFKILTAVTRQTVRAVRRVQTFPVQIRKPGGEVLAEAVARLPLSDPLADKPSVIGVFAGGQVALRLGNSTGQPQPLTLELQPPPGLAVDDAQRRLELAAGKPVSMSFAANRREAAMVEGFYRVAYRLVSANGAAQAGETVIELRPQSRWWVGQREIRTGPALGGEGDDELSLGKGEGDVDALVKEIEPAARSETEKAWSAPPPAIFKAARPPAGWRLVTHGASLWTGQLTPTPAAKMIVSAATRVLATADRETFVKVAWETPNWTWLDGTLLASRDWGSRPGVDPFTGRIWLNGDVVYDSRPEAKQPRQPARLRKGGNSLLVQYQANVDGRGGHGNVFVLFHDSATGARLDDLVFDVEAKP